MDHVICDGIFEQFFATQLSEIYSIHRFGFGVRDCVYGTSIFMMIDDSIFPKCVNG